MSAPHVPAGAHGHHDAPPPEDGHGHATRRGYVTGFLLSAVLTAVPFWLVMTGAISSVQTTAIIVIALAFVQIIVHTFFFLHVNRQSEGGWTLLAFIFTLVIVAIVIAGSLWIMYHLNTNMMPMGSDMMGSDMVGGDMMGGNMGGGDMMGME